MNKDLESENESLRSQNIDAIKENLRLHEVIRKLYQFSRVDKNCAHCRDKMSKVIMEAEVL